MSTITIAQHSAHPLTVSRLGYGTMRLTGPDIWGEPANRPEALQILRTAVEQGVNFIDTADYYGEDVTNRLIREALHPYSSDLVICTKVGATRRPDKSWVPYNRPENLRASIDNNLRTLRQEQIQLVHLRLIGHGDVPFDEQLGAMFELQQEGKIQHVGLSNVSREQAEAGLKMGSIATIENMYGHGQRTTLRTPHGDNQGGEEVLDFCEQHSIPLIPYFSLVNSLPKADSQVAEVARRHHATEAQINLAWLLHKSPWILPIPGTSKLAHLRENLQAAAIQLSADDLAFLG
ncbi:aldo/keto reductase [Hymenobacter persicinus]|uniref:Aldo/keto reductase n=1 Tax=Hymenobacter persicinus TaxID=2025506 RepID=A0A4Q5LCA6_9BACT|nr:aldo/keto reductase [Hymenobacter persicinus]RYU80479.1 aldo/keto reductase [Hymenobacter persicinus]